MTPLVILVGFLGSGKTTYLRQLLPQLRQCGLEPCVIINDYQNAQVDAQLLQGLAESLQAISGSCVCCGSRDELSIALTNFAHGPKRVLVVETNGTTDSEELIEMLSLDQSLGKFTLPIQLSIVDAKRWQKRFWHNSLELEQARTANYLYISRHEEISAKRMAQVDDSLAKHGVAVPRKEPEQFARELSSISAAVGATPARTVHTHSEDCECCDHGHHHHESNHHHFASMQLDLPALLERKNLERFLHSLGEEVIRAKGIVRLAESPKEFHVFQKTDRGHVQLLPIGPTSSISDPVGIFIGPHIDEAALRASSEAHFSGALT